MNYPALIIDSKKLQYNIKYMAQLCNQAGIDICAVTKVFCAHPAIAKVFVDTGIQMLGDSRIQNLKKLAKFPVKKMMLRIPMLSEVENVVKYADISLNSEIKTIEALSRAAEKHGTKHGILLMIELGDLREGIMVEDAVQFAGEVIALNGVQLLGVGTNLNCYGGVLPTEKNLSLLVQIAQEIEKTYAIHLPIVSGGNSGSVYLLTEKRMPAGINQLRLGEVILRGHETSYQKRIDELYTDVFKFRAEIIELKHKPSVPFGEIGTDAFGNKRVYKDKGIMKRAIVACGRQDVLWEQLTPIDKEISFIGASSDHFILDVTHALKDYSVGDTVDFSLSYGALLAACTSEYVFKVIK